FPQRYTGHSLGAGGVTRLNGLPGTPIEQELPFFLLNAPEQQLCLGVRASMPLTLVDEMKRVPALGAMRETKAPRRLRQGLEDRMIAHAPEPISRVASVRLAAVHDAVPETPLDRGNRLANRVRLVQEVVVKPERGQARLGGIQPLHLA